MIIYSTIWWSKSLASIIGPTLNVLESVVATLVLMVLMIIVSKIWGWTKMKFPNYATKVAWGVVGLLLIIFLLS